MAIFKCTPRGDGSRTLRESRSRGRSNVREETLVAHAFRTRIEQECELTVAFDTFAKPLADARYLRIADAKGGVRRLYMWWVSALAGLVCINYAFPPTTRRSLLPAASGRSGGFGVHEIGQIGLAPPPGVFFARPRARRRDCLQNVAHRGIGAEFLRENGQPVPPNTWTVAAGEADDHKRIVSQAD
jgi:hypothetical protein